MNPRQIALLVGGYAGIGALYILFSDAVLFRFFPDLPTAYHLGIIKGLGFIGVTAAVLAWLLNRINAGERSRYAGMFAHHGAVMLLVESESGNIVDATPDAERFYGMSRQQLLARKVGELEVPPEEGTTVNWGTFLSGEVGTCHCRQQGAGAQACDVVIHSGPIAHEGRRLLLLIVQDESVRLRLTRELEQAEARWRFALEGAGHGVWEWNAQTGSTFHSDLWKTMLGYTLGELEDTLETWESRVHPDDLAAVRAAINDHLAGRTPLYQSEHRLRCKDGEYRWIADRGRVLTRAADGLPLLVFGTHTDITERKRYDLALRSSEVLYRNLFESHPIPMWVFDRQTLRFLAVNDAAVTHYGYTRAEFLTMTIKDIRPAEDVPRLMQSVTQLQGGMDHAGVWRHLRRDGSLIDVEITTHALDFGDRPAELVLAHNITERLRAETALRDSEARFRALVEQSLVGIYMISSDCVEYMNPRAAEIFGYAEHEVKGLPQEKFVCPADRARITENLRQRLTGQAQSMQQEFTGLRKDGTEVRIGSHGTVADLDGRRLIIGVLQDITEKSRSEETIRDYVRRLESAVLGTAAAVSQLVELRDPYTAGHERRVGELSAAIAAEMGLDDDMQKGLRVAGAMHDVGKIVVPTEILAKPGRLSAVEMELVRQHAQQGYEVLEKVAFPWPVAEVARQHHERLDGSGYPRGLKDGEIILEARILAVADVVESMASHRPYRPSLGLDKALAEIERHAGVLYDADAVAACVRLFRTKGYQIPA